MAAYHRFENPLFDRVLERVAAAPAALGLILPRTPQQAAALEARGLPAALRVVRQVPDGLNLLWHSDLVIGAGGTMNREAAVLGVPVYTVFAGRPAAVDEALIEAGRLTRLDDETDLDRIRFRKRHEATRAAAGTRVLDCVMAEIGRFLEAAA
jgi:uncharacterized protein